MSRDDLPAIADLPPMQPPVTVVGDVHLTERHPETARRFLAYVDSLAGGGGTVVLLGDLFDWWVGRRQARVPFARTVLEALRGLAAAGVHLAFQAGNRDYAFDGAEGLDIDIWPDVVRTRWGERTVLLSHGDLLCSEDHAYLAMRRFLHMRLSRAVQRRLPLGVTTSIARGLRGASARSAPRNAGARLGLDYGLARAWLAHYDADVLVTGHVHTGVHHRLPGGEEILVLKDWHGTGGVVRFDEAGIRLIPAVP